VECLALLLPCCPTIAIDATDAEGLTPLHYAAGYGHPRCVQWLLQRGANSRLPDARGAASTAS
jgi:ankyrin repeat protein